jgi:phosphopantetheine--protein transferase-like protein
MVGIGIDIVELERVRSISDLARFAEYFLTAGEMESFTQAKDPIAFIASRFAAKEAIIKAFPGFLKPHDFEIIKDGKKPAVRFIQSEIDARWGMFVSISHSTDYAAGYAAAFDKTNGSANTNEISRLSC